MQKELTDIKSDSEDFLRAFLLLILAGTNRKYAHTYGLSPDRVSNITAFKFKELIEKNIRYTQKVEEYAAILKVSRISLNKIVTTQLYITASQFIKNRLLTDIKRELLYSSKNISEIAYELNFSEPQHLIRFFKEREQQTPSIFRSAYQNGYLLA